MTRTDATKTCRTVLDANALNNWHIRLSTDVNSGFLGLCSHKDQTIILNAHHLDMHPDPEIINTINHEVAHALVGPSHGHDEIWRTKAIELGCTNTAPCSHLSFTPEVIDAIRSGADVEVTFETETIHRPKYTINRLQDKCEKCGKVAVEVKSLEYKGKKYISLECGHVIIKELPKLTPYELFFDNMGSDDCAHEWDKNLCVACGKHRLYQFQVDGARFIERGLAMQRGVGVFDEMGLGKTIQALAYIKFHLESCPVLYIVKSGIKYQWYKAIIQWLGMDYLAQVITSGKDQLLPGLKSYIVSYDMLRNFKLERFKEAGIRTVVLDECQQIKNVDSTRTSETRKIVKDAKHVIPLSGTPWKNRGSEFFVALNMLDPLKFNSYERFKHQWIDYYYDGGKLKEGGIRNIKRFKEYTTDLIIRRERTEVMPELPLVNRVKLYCQMEDHAKKAYEEGVSEFVKFYNSAVIGGDEGGFATQQGILARLAALRQITGLAKIPLTLDAVDEHIEETDRKIVVFVHHIAVGELLLAQCKKLESVKDKNVPILQLHSGLSAEQRMMIQEEFNAAPQAVLIASTLAAGEGLNLQTCSDCILHERQWNPANEEQAEGRFIRIGQIAESVTAKYATAVATVDEQLDIIVERKRRAFHSTMNKGEVAKWNQESIVKELAESIVRAYKNGSSKGK